MKFYYYLSVFMGSSSAFAERKRKMLSELIYVTCELFARIPDEISLKLASLSWNMTRLFNIFIVK